MNGSRRTARAPLFLSALGLAAGLVLLHSAVAFAQSESRLALVIGNAAYSGPGAALKNPVNDAREIASALKELGFEVMLSENADHAAMRRTIRAFEDGLRQAKGVGLLYFAGHGVQLAGHNYLVPIGPQLVAETELRERTVDATELVERLREAGGRLNIVILDACRDNPLVKPTYVLRGSKATPVGLAPMRPASGTLVAFATEAGRIATDGDANRGYYARYLVQYMRTPGLTLEQVFKRVREAVERETNGKQLPVEYNALTGTDFYFLPPAQGQ
jgi:uncharacterized caspase-like protein